MGQKHESKRRENTTNQTTNFLDYKHEKLYQIMIIDEMTLFDMNDDQQVPDCTFDVINSNGGATIIQKSLPDLDSLLSDLQGIADAEERLKQKSQATPDSTTPVPAAPVTYDVPIQELIDAPIPDLSTWEMETHNEMSFYEDYSMQLNIKTEV